MRTDCLKITFVTAHICCTPVISSPFEPPRASNCFTHAAFLFLSLLIHLHCSVSLAVFWVIPPAFLNSIIHLGWLQPNKPHLTMGINTGMVLILIIIGVIPFSINAFYNMVQLQRNNQQMQPVTLTIIMPNFTLTVHFMSALMCQVAMTVSSNVATNLSMWNELKKREQFPIFFFSFFFSSSCGCLTPELDYLFKSSRYEVRIPVFLFLKAKSEFPSMTCTNLQRTASVSLKHLPKK